MAQDFEKAVTGRRLESTERDWSTRLACRGLLPVAGRKDIPAGCSVRRRAPCFPPGALLAFPPHCQGTYGAALCPHPSPTPVLLEVPGPSSLRPLPISARSHSSLLLAPCPPAPALSRLAFLRPRADPCGALTFPGSLCVEGYVRSFSPVAPALHLWFSGSFLLVMSYAPPPLPQALCPPALGAVLFPASVPLLSPHPNHL